MTTSFFANCLQFEDGIETVAIISESNLARTAGLGDGMVCLRRGLHCSGGTKFESNRLGALATRGTERSSFGEVNCLRCDVEAVYQQRRMRVL